MRRCAFFRFWGCYSIHMKRTNLVLNEEALENARRILGVRTYSAAVNAALEELVRIRKIQSLPLFFGKGLWQGDLAEMREDRGHKAGGRGRGRK